MKLLVTVRWRTRDGEASRQTLTEMASVTRAVEMAIDALLPSAQRAITRVEVLVSGDECVLGDDFLVASQSFADSRKRQKVRPSFSAEEE